MPSRVEETPLTGWMMIGIGVGLVLIVGSIIWFAIPGPDTRHDLVSPTGAAHLELAEQCENGACERVMIFERDDQRRACAIGQFDTTGPIFETAGAEWSADETVATVTAMGADGIERRFAFDFSTCEAGQ